MMPFAMLRQYRCCYLASPYSMHQFGQEAAWAEASNLAGELVAEGVKVFSPISHSHSLCENNTDLDALDHELWMDQDEFFMDACDALVVAMFPGWENSVGVREERDFFEARKKPIHFLDPTKMELR